MNRRAVIARHWLGGRRHGVSLVELGRFLFSRTCVPKAKRLIDSEDEVDQWLRVRMRGVSGPLYYPRHGSLPQLYQVIAELLSPADWHYYEIPETRVEPDDTVVDCGAAEGLFSLLVAERCKKVYAVEPLPSFVEAMNKTFEGNARVEVVPVALSDADGTAFLSDSGIVSSLSDNSSGTPVRVTTLDRFLQGRAVNYIKADLEGHELEMLKGACDTIRTYGPKLAITTYHRGDHAEAIESYLRSLNGRYRIKVKGVEERVGAPVMLHAWLE